MLLLSLYNKISGDIISLTEHLERKEVEGNDFFFFFFILELKLREGMVFHWTHHFSFLPN